MMHNKAFQYRLYPNKEQKELINRKMGCARYVYNHYRDINASINILKEGLFILSGKKEPQGLRG